MKHKVFVLYYRCSLKQGGPEIQYKGNEDELNKLLDEGWLVQDTIQPESPNAATCSIVYNLRKAKPSESQSV